MPPGTSSLISVPELEELPSVSLPPMRAARSRIPCSPKCPSRPLSAITGSKSQFELSEKLSAQEKQMIEAALRESGGQVSRPSGAAAKLGIHRSTLESEMGSLGINKYRFKTASTSKNS